MAGTDAVVATNPQFHVSRQQFDALFASQKAFHEVAIKVTDILQDSSRSACYQSLPRNLDNDIDLNYVCQQDIPGNGVSVPREQHNRIGHHSERRTPGPQERTQTADEKISFQVENMRARKAYKQKRQRSINLYARAPASHLDADYDFQCMPAS